jgi:hypothetical protein
LADVVSHRADFKVILVYDVSRWGRFQDTDEAAHYEFLCKSAGVPVVYCAEQFTNDSSIRSSIMKTLKRTMAAEFSRELGVKVFAGKVRLVREGFRAGGGPGYGLRRMLLSATGEPKGVLGPGDHKSYAKDRVILVPNTSRPSSDGFMTSCSIKVRCKRSKCIPTGRIRAETGRLYLFGTPHAIRATPRELAERIAAALPQSVIVQRRNLKVRPTLLVDGMIRVDILICPFRPTTERVRRWFFYPHRKQETTDFTLACLL